MPNAVICLYVDPQSLLVKVMMNYPAASLATVYSYAELSRPVRVAWWQNRDRAAPRRAERSTTVHAIVVTSLLWSDVDVMMMKYCLRADL